MTRELHPNGPTRAGERAARREIIDRVAMAMAHQKGRNWSRMTGARRDQLRSQVRAGLRALRSDRSEAWAYVAVPASEAAADGADATTVSNHFDAFLSEVLK